MAKSKLQESSILPEETKVSSKKGRKLNVVSTANPFNDPTLPSAPSNTQHTSQGTVKLRKEKDNGK